MSTMCSEKVLNYGSDVVASKELLRFAKKYSPFYSELYKNMTEESLQLENAPLTPHALYWKANRQWTGSVTTRPHVDGIILRTGGTTSHPKFTALSQMELQRIATLLGNGLVEAGLEAGDRVGNLFYAGDLYGSFLLHILSVMALPIPAIQVPIGGFTNAESMESLLDQCRVNVVLTTITTLVKFAGKMLTKNRTFPDVRKIMFSGEHFFEDQRLTIKALFPNAAVQSCIYGSIDAGVIGYTAGTSDTRVHRVVKGAMIAEICADGIDDDIIRENDIAGRLIVTNLIRSLTPVIRYPTGDRAEWVDYEKGIFRLLNRDGIALRLGPVSLDVQDLKKLILKALPGTSDITLQAVIDRPSGKDRLICRIDAKPDNVKEAEAAIRKLLYDDRPMLKEHVHMGYISEVEVAFMSMTDMDVNPATGKLPQLLDTRNGSCAWLAQAA